MSSPLPRFSRRSLVSKYARQCADHLDRAEWRRVMDQLAGLDLSRTYIPADRRINSPSEAELRVILDRLGKRTREDELNCGACGYDTCREHAVAIFRGIAESEMCLPFTIDELRRTVGELAVSNRQLADVQEALVQSEKLASMGQLAAGIAHEINNPLGIVLMYSHLLLDEHGADPGLREDLTMIAEQTDRCKKIVAGLLHFARQNKIVRHPVELPGLVTRTLRAHATPAAVKIEVQNLLTDPTAEVDGDQLAQVIANLVGNAVDAMPEGGFLTISLDGDPESVRLSVADTGPGIPAENLPKIFEPFFTTKPLGRGTGLGLAVSHGIVKKHGGEITVETNSDADAGPTGSVFTVRLPRRGLAE